jgi:hypothetical protein
MGDRFAIGKEDLSRLQQMYDRFMYHANFGRALLINEPELRDSGFGIGR